MAVQAVHQQLFLLNHGHDTECKSEGDVHEKVLCSQPVIVVLSFFCLFDIL